MVSVGVKSHPLPLICTQLRCIVILGVMREEGQGTGEISVHLEVWSVCFSPDIPSHFLSSENLPSGVLNEAALAFFCCPSQNVKKLKMKSLPSEIPQNRYALKQAVGFVFGGFFDLLFNNVVKFQSFGTRIQMQHLCTTENHRHNNIKWKSRCFVEPFNDNFLLCPLIYEYHHKLKIPHIHLGKKRAFIWLGKLRGKANGDGFQWLFLVLKLIFFSLFVSFLSRHTIGKAIKFEILSLCIFVPPPTARPGDPINFKVIRQSRDKPLGHQSHSSRNC